MLKGCKSLKQTEINSIIAITLAPVIITETNRILQYRKLPLTTHNNLIPILNTILK